MIWKWLLHDNQEESRGTCRLLYEEPFTCQNSTRDQIQPEDSSAALQERKNFTQTPMGNF